jgi:ubiquinone/menaquinone biosynthesis C-methylase UbiE
VAAAYDFSGVGHVVDVGGGIGSMLAAALSAAPETTTGTLFDLPHVIVEARESLAASPIADRFSYAEGSFFDGVPAGGDAYILSHILHDWPDEKCLTVLQHCRQVLKPDGRILVVEAVLPDGDEPHPVKIADMAMAIGLGGSERTDAEYDALFAAAGLRLTGITPTSSMVSVLEARTA